MPRTVDTLAARLKLARAKRRLTQQQLVDLVGEKFKQSDLSKLETGRMMKTSHISRLARALRVPPDWLELGHGDEPDWNAPTENSSTPRFGVAQDLSQLGPTLDPTMIGWGDLMKKLPAAFSLPVRDDAIDAWATTGQVGLFRPLKPGEKIAPGKRVLVIDKKDNPYLRVYKERTPTHWQAVATNENYDPLDSIEHGLRVIAIMTGVKWE